MESISESTSLSQHQMRKFNPGLLQTDEEVAAQFVVRKNEFNTVCEVIRGNIASPSCQHALVVGSRGQGKSMLLRRVAAELRMDSELSNHFLPVQFMEENQELDNLADFWMETLFQVARELASRDAMLSKELKATHRSLAFRWSEQGFEDLARAAVLNAADRIDRRLVLMVENVQSLFSETDDDFGWVLRADLQTVPQITLIASATSRFEALDDPQAPFFEFFRFVHLAPLNASACGRLWSTVSGTTMVTKQSRPLEILTGGNPRLIVVVASFAQHRSFRQLMEELVILVDEHTEYFRNQLDILPAKERRVFISLIALWQPAATSDIAARARLDVRVVSTMLKRLLERGVITIVEENGPRKRLYAASERLFSIYYKLRREYDERAVVESLIHFMESFYDVKDEYKINEQLFTDALDSSVTPAGIENALIKRALSADVSTRLKQGIVARTSSNATNEKLLSAQQRLMERVEEAHIDKNWQGLLDFAERFREDGFLEKGTKNDQDHSWVLISRARSEAFLALEEFDCVIRIGEEAEVRLEDASDRMLGQAYCQIKLNQICAQFQLMDYSRMKLECEKSIQYFAESDDVIILAQVVFIFVLLADVEIRLGNVTISMTLLDEVLSKYEKYEAAELEQAMALARLRRSELLGRNDADFNHAIQSLDEFIERYKSSENEPIRSFRISAQNDRAIKYGMQGEFEREIAAFDSLIASVTAEDDVRTKVCKYVVLLQRGRRLAEVGRSDEALTSCEDAQRWLDGNRDLPFRLERWGRDWYANCTRALAFMKLGRVEEALHEFQTAYGAFDSDRAFDLEEIMRLVPELIDAGAREHDLIDVLQSKEWKARFLVPLIVCLKRRVGESVTAPVEASEVAEDLEKSIKLRLVHGLRPGYGLVPPELN